MNPGDLDGAEQQPRRVRSRPVSSIPMKRRTWLWDQRVPLGELTLWVGHAGIGKSQSAVWLAAELSRGRLLGELHGTPSPVLYLGTEDSWSYTLAPRFAASGADLDMVHQLYAETFTGDETVVSLSLDLDELREEVKGTGARLVVLDALLSTMSGQDLMKQGVVRGYLEPVSRLAQDLNIAVVGVAHFRKAGGTDPLHMISGSAEFGQVVRSAIGFAADRESDDGSCVLSLIKSNIAPQGTSSLRYRIDPAVVDTPEGPTDVGRFVPLGETEQNVRDLIDQTPTTADDRGERDEAADWLTGYLQDQGGTASAADVFKAARADGIAEATLKRARKRAGVTSERRGFGQGSIWTLDPLGSHSAHSDQGTGADPNEPNGDPNGDTGTCRTCGTPTKSWVIAERAGHCITCSRKESA
jgi:hypothetical protein